MQKKYIPSEKGQSLVEMALTATLMLFLMLATIDFGYGFLYWITIRDAAQEGAMFGSLHPSPACDNTLRAWVKDSATSAVIRTSTLQDGNITITRTGTNPGNSITVTVVHNYHILTPLVSTFTGTTSIPVKASVTNTILQNIADDDCH